MSNEFPNNKPGVTLNSAARADFDRALFKSFWREVGSLLTQRSNDLLPFDEVRKHLELKGQHYVGLRQVPIEMILGSVNRYQDFDRAFLPRQSYTKERWMSIDRAHLQDILLPPIELYKIGEVYFVKDGNHRVSVAREKGQAFIDAVVIEIETDVPVTPQTNIGELILAQERISFYQQTHLEELRPEAHIELTLPGQYDRLLEHISVHRWYMGEQRDEEVPDEEAVASWYDQVYLPLVEVIRQRGILGDFPGRTEADLYLWIIEHLHFLIERLKDEVSLEEAATDFVENYSQRPVKKIIRFMKRAAGALWSGPDVEDEEPEPDYGEDQDKE